MNANNVKETARRVLENGEQLARNIWLAGLGLYSKSIEEAQGLGDKTGEVFEELVTRGQEVEFATRQRLEETRERASDKVEERVNELFLKLSGIDRRKLEEMNDKLDKLAAAVEALSRNK